MLCREHLGKVTQKTKSGHIRTGMNVHCGKRLERDGVGGQHGFRCFRIGLFSDDLMEIRSGRDA